MRIVFYTSGITGSGRVVYGISIGTALRRRGVDAEITILSSSPFASLADRLGFNHVEISLESEEELSEATYRRSELYKAITSLKPDILIVDLQWFSLHSFIQALQCAKVFLCRQVDDRFFTVPLSNGSISFRSEDYTEVIATEPFACKIPMRRVNPLVIRNRDEILSREEVRKRLDLHGSNKVCLFAFNGEPGEFERIKKQYSYLEDVGYTMVYSTNYDGGLFPAVDYFNAFDLIICSAGYNAFWEAVYFRKEAIFVPVQRRFESQRQRIQECGGQFFDENGADQLVDILINF